MGSRGRQSLGLFDYKRRCEICDISFKNGKSLGFHRYRFHRGDKKALEIALNNEKVSKPS